MPNTVPSCGATCAMQLAAVMPPPPGMLTTTIAGLPGMCLPMKRAISREY